MAGINTDKYKYWTLYINTGNTLSSEDFKTKSEADQRAKEFEGRGWKLEVIRNSNYAKPDFSNGDSYTHKLKKILNDIKEYDEGDEAFRNTLLEKEKG